MKQQKLVVITSMRNQSSNIRTIVDGYLKSSRKPDLILFLLDRSEDDSRQVLDDALSYGELNYAILNTPWSDDIFAAGRPRDFGIDQARKLVPDASIFVFLDGDCIPSPKLFQEHERVHNIIGNYPCLVNGMRLGLEIDGSVSNDPRLANPSIFSPNKDVVLYNDKHLYVDNNMIPACWGCNMSLNLPAIRAARTINSIVLGDIDRAFSSVFDGRWGGEDPFIAATLYRANCYIVNLDPLGSYVTHLWHKGDHRNNEHARVLQRSLASFRQHILDQSLVVDYSDINDNGTIKSVPDLIYYTYAALHSNFSCIDKETCLRSLSRVSKRPSRFGQGQKCGGGTELPCTMVLDINDLKDIQFADYTPPHKNTREPSSHVYYESGLFR